jgi:putative ABC transport system substrate-binding protein
MRRRQFITLIGGAAAAWPLAARAQQPTVPTIGILVRAVPGSEEFRHLFPEALRDLGYIDGKNIHFEVRSDEGQINRLPELAAELVRLKVDVMVPWFTPAAAAAKQATREIPIVCAACGDCRDWTGREPRSAGRKCHRNFRRCRRAVGEAC